MAKNPQFMIDLVKRFIAEPNKKVYTAKSGNVKLWKDAGVVRLQHYNHVILEVDLNGEYQADNFHEMITRWHIQSVTDAGYVETVISHLFQSRPFRVGYKPVNGGGYFQAFVPQGGRSWDEEEYAAQLKDETNWVDVGGEY